MDELQDALKRIPEDWNGSVTWREPVLVLRKYARLVADPNIEAAVEAQADKLMEGYAMFRHPDSGGSELKRYEIVEMLQWSMSAAVAAAFTPGDTNDYPGQHEGPWT